MTTGRINQVTTMPNRANAASPRYLRRSTFPNGWSSLQGVKNRLCFLTGAQPATGVFRCEAYSAVERASPKSPPCFPISQILDQLLLVLRTKITAFNEDYQLPTAPERCHTATAYPRVVNCKQIWPLANNPHPSTTQATIQRECCLAFSRSQTWMFSKIPTISFTNQ